MPIGFVEQSLTAQRAGGDRNYLHGQQDIHEADINFQRRVRDMYRRQAALDPHFIVVDCSDAEGRMLPPDDIFDKIKAVYESYPKD